MPPPEPSRPPPPPPLPPPAQPCQQGEARGGEAKGGGSRKRNACQDRREERLYSEACSERDVALGKCSVAMWQITDMKASLAQVSSERDMAVGQLQGMQWQINTMATNHDQHVKELTKQHNQRMHDLQLRSQEQEQRWDKEKHNLKIHYENRKQQQIDEYKMVKEKQLDHKERQIIKLKADLDNATDECGKLKAKLNKAWHSIQLHVGIDSGSLVCCQATLDLKDKARFLKNDALACHVTVSDQCCQEQELVAYMAFTEDVESMVNEVPLDKNISSVYEKHDCRVFRMMQRRRNRPRRRKRQFKAVPGV